MAKFGNFVEKVIGHAKKAKVSVKPAQGVEPILALEGQLPIVKLKEISEASVERTIKPLIPNLLDKSSLEVGEGETKFSPLMKEKNASISLHIDISGSGGGYPKESQTPGVHTIKAEVRNFPIEDGFFDYVVADLATQKQGDIVKTMKEISRVVTLGGTGIIVDFHPFGNFAKRGSVRMRSMESVIRGIEDYYKICKASGFILKNIKEAFFDETVRKFFITDEEKTAFRAIKNTPFLIFIFVTKQGR